MRTIDTANARGIPKAIPALKKAGVNAVILYMGIGGTVIPEKRATKAVCDALKANGLGIITCVESTADWMLGGYVAGLSAAALTRTDSIKCGGPVDPFMWAAHDTDVTSASDIAKITTCVSGMREVAGVGKVGIYGSAKVCLAVHTTFPDVPMWQSCSTGWSGFRPEAKAKAAGFAMWQSMEQLDLGIDHDLNVCFTDNLGQWGSTVLPAPETPKDVPPTTEVPVSQIDEVLKVAASQKGITESPANSNNVKYNTWYYGHPVSGGAYPWCMAYASWVGDKAGVLKLIFGKSVSTVATANEFMAHKQWRTKGERGDLVFYDFSPKERIQHVGWVVKYYPDGSVDAWEGNTSAGTSGSQSNGGGVFLRHRPKSDIVGFGRPAWNNTPVPPVTHAPVVDAGPGAVYRLFNGKHFFTASVVEANAVQDMGYKYEGVAWFADPLENSIPVERYFKGTAHLWTTSPAEKAALLKGGWKHEGTAFYAAPTGGVPVYRFRSKTGHYFYSLDQTEGTKAGYALEGAAFRIV